MTPELVRLGLPQTLRALKNLESLVVSLDRLGSTRSDLTNGEFDRAVSEFVVRWKVTRKLADLRRMLADAYCKSIGSAGEKKLEKQLSNVPHWTSDNRKPPPG